MIRPTLPRRTSRSSSTPRPISRGEGVKADYLPGIGHPAETIAQVAKERDADLVILGTKEPGLIARLFGQSVSESVAHRVHCDVMFVH